MSTHIALFTRIRSLGSLLPAAILLLLLAPTLATAQVRQTSLEELTRASSTILVGTAGDQESFWNADRTKIYTRITVRVEEALKGQATTQTSITVPGGRVGNIAYEVSEMPVFTRGEEVLVFLRQQQNGTGPQVVTGATLGKMTVVDDPQTGERIVQHAPQLLRTLTSSLTEGLSLEGAVTLDQMRRAIKDIDDSNR